MNSVPYMQYLGLSGTWKPTAWETERLFFSLQEAIIKKLPKQGLNKTQELRDWKKQNREGEGDVEKQACVAC